MRICLTQKKHSRLVLRERIGILWGVGALCLTLHESTAILWRWVLSTLLAVNACQPLAGNSLVYVLWMQGEEVLKF